MSCTKIDNLVDEWGRLIFLWTCFVQIVKIGTHTYGALFFHDRNKVGSPICVINAIDELKFVKLIDFSFYCFYLGWVQLRLFLAYWWYVRPGVNMVLYSSGTKPRHFKVAQREYISILLQQLGVIFYLLW